MAWITKETRRTVYQKTNGHCGYCGVKLPYNEFQLDHIVPRHLFKVKPAKWMQKNFPNVKVESLDNYMPSCERCNMWKGTLTLEKFRNEIWTQLLNLKSNRKYKLALDYKLVNETPKPVKFYFETITNR